MRTGAKCWTEHLTQTTYACRGDDRQGEIHPLTMPPLLAVSRPPFDRSGLHLNVSETHSPQLATESGWGPRLLVPYLCLIALQALCSALNSTVSRFSFDRLISTSTIVAYAAPLRAKSSNSG